MTQGARIKRIREFRNLTQKELGLRCGFSENTADVRIRQYETNSKTPREDTLTALANALTVNYRALQNYDMECAEDILETLFWLEESVGIRLFGFTHDNDSDNDWIFNAKYNYYTFSDSLPPVGITIRYGLVNDFMNEWLLHYNEFQKKEISYEQYFDWKLNWPLSCDAERNKSDYFDWKNNS